MKAIKFLPLVIALALAACGERNPGNDSAASASAPAVSAAAAPAPQAAPIADPAPAPTAAPAAAVAAPSEAELIKGEKVFAATCQACHGAGVLGAPKSGDSASWAPRIAQGVDTLHKNAIDGIRMMPPKGGNPALKDDEVIAAVDYMVSKSK
jgi:cytochrome c5